MKSDSQFVPRIDNQFLENQRRFPTDELLRYQGQHIAWSWDGSQILAAGLDRGSLDQKLRHAGINPLEVIHDLVDDPNVSYLG